ncbi:ABC transporter permease subunit [Devosia sp. FJ2-5-3]|uniref:amino acid ABC transporter permease n=1 Tax=Devosia sp. FJ2-5-3 TaxID=2976680 RepID=UPI0023D89E07|nr:ABC transporter permease subunit [Devosia sp. FJ2-5-3]WEJ57199.1 ABC transporter permease subunit [Devosia sp. FJ2-5-3]
MAVQDNLAAPPRTAFYNDPVIRGILYQVLVAAAVIVFFVWIIMNTAANLAAQNKSTGFDFLFQTSGFGISFSLIPFDRSSYYWEAFLVGLLNTLLVAAIGIVFATMLGFVLGVARLSSNWLIARFATVYIEIIRNVPLLLQLFFWYFAVLKAMPAVRESFELPLGVFVNQRGIVVPRPMPDAEITWVVVAAVLSIIAAIALVRWSVGVRAQTGHYPPFVKLGSRIAALVVTFLFGYLAFSLLGSVVPALGTNSLLPLVGAAALAALSLTTMGVYGRAFIGFAIAWAIGRFALGGMFGFMSELAIAAVSGLLALAYGWTLLGADRRPAARDSKFPLALPVLLIIAVPALIYWVTGASLAFEMPLLERFNFRGGLQLVPEMVALVMGLTIYTAAFIAENVRSGIQAVNKGQTEAAASLGLREGDRLRLVVIPQAMRVIIPPLTSQYLNLTKNSSLGAAIGYPELVNVFMGTTLNQTGKAIEVIAITMAVYLTLSLSTSAFMNWYNARVALVER